jgi:hypothetical protein
VSESPETTPLSAAAKALAVAITGNPDEVPTPLERERAEAVVRAYDAARATVPADHLRREVERILGNGPMWASDYAYEVLEAALAARPVPAADTRKPSDARGSLAGSPLTVKEHARRLAVPPVPQAVPAADDRERPDPVADMETFLGWLFRDGGLEPPRREYDDVQEALAALLWKHGCDHRAGVFPSTGWKPATAKGTAIGEDEWGRPLHVWTGSPSTGDALRAAAQAVVDALPDPIRYAEDGGPIIDTLTVRSPEIVALRAALTRPSTGDDPTLDGTDGAHPAWWRGCDFGYAKGIASTGDDRLREALRVCVGEDHRPGCLHALRSRDGYEAWKASTEPPCTDCGGGKGLGHTTDCPAVAGDRGRIEQAFIDGSVEGSPIDHDGNSRGVSTGDDRLREALEEHERMLAGAMGWEAAIAATDALRAALGEENDRG